MRNGKSGWNRDMSQLQSGNDDDGVITTRPDQCAGGNIAGLGVAKPLHVPSDRTGGGNTRP